MEQLSDGRVRCAINGIRPPLQYSVVSAFLCVGPFLVSKLWLRIGAETYT
jgi:hypothetical protein